ncbi:hypothetical protein NSMM_260083 [Nitrosomonas mobilis]|uniref:Uncharacterized protein n=1 Tax=Nitrosomonas mobilis TaxID=51642 RepID=A0A1G5SCS4_9PROT|nr:hypothetical protein NSMM_260083 [Nitrosomonas mobilis]
MLSANSGLNPIFTHAANGRNPEFLMLNFQLCPIFTPAAAIFTQVHTIQELISF